MNARKQRIEALFDAALELNSPEQREVYLSRAAGDDAQLRQEVETLINAYEKSGEFLAAQTEARDHGTIAASPAPTVPSEAPGDVIGRYKLLQKIGEGACGVVYMAEQEEPVRRRVALKIIKLGMDTKSVIARFEAERQALALMDHPNIAKVHDAGATETGRPYFVMELVRGTKITDYCDEKNLSTQERLDLFIKVCQAVQHAHQKGIIHRDIKPSNILVTVNDGVAVPKVIDFGIAKATTDQRLTDKTVFTAFEQFIGTPAYMSPEQAEITSVDVDTRSDVYSLGVLLYELLTGKTPFDAAELLKIGLDEMRRTIRAKEPERPSTKVSTLGGEELTRTAKRRGLDAPKLVNVLRGDLDWIVMKCLEKDRARRYETANGLAMDIQRHLGNEPVLACPPSKLYRLQKTFQRNKLAFAMSAATASSLILALGVSNWMFFQERAAKSEQMHLRQRTQVSEERARENERQAQQHAAMSQQTARFLKDLLRSVGPLHAIGRDTTLVKELLDQAAERITRELANQPAVEIDLLNDLVVTYDELGMVSEEEALARRSMDVAAASFPRQSPAYSQALYTQAIALLSIGKLEEAEKTAAESVAIRRRLLPDQPQSIISGSTQQINLHITGRVEPDDLYQSLNVWAATLYHGGRFSDAEAAYREALSVSRKFVGGEHRDVATQLSGLGLVLREEGRTADAEATLRESLAIYRKLSAGKPHPDVATLLNNLALVLKTERNFVESGNLFRESLEMSKGMFGPESKAVAVCLHNLANVAQLQGRHEEAEALGRDAVGMARKLGNDDLFLSAALNSFGITLSKEGKLDEARKLVTEGLTLRHKLLASQDPRTADSTTTLAWIVERQGRHTEAEPLLLLACEGVTKGKVKMTADANVRMKETAQGLVQAYQEAGQTEQALLWKQKLSEIEGLAEAKMQAVTNR